MLQPSTIGLKFGVILYQLTCLLTASSLKELQYDDKIYKKAADYFEQHLQQGYSNCYQKIIRPLEMYFSHLKDPLLTETTHLHRHFDNLLEDEDTLAERTQLIKLLMLQHYFEDDFNDEYNKIKQGQRINYLVVRFEEQPVAFFSTELNYKSGHVYLRFVTVAPAFHQLGLGKAALNEIAKYYPESTGMELYTRNANHAAIGFYEHVDFKSGPFDFSERDLLSQLYYYFPTSDATSHPECFKGYFKLTSPVFP